MLERFVSLYWPDVLPDAKQITSRACWTVKSSALTVSHLAPQCATLSKHINVQLKTQMLCSLVVENSDTLKPQPTGAQEREFIGICNQEIAKNLDELRSELLIIYPKKLFLWP
jgi:hypothetical protein